MQWQISNRQLCKSPKVTANTHRVNSIGPLSLTYLVRCGSRFSRQKKPKDVNVCVREQSEGVELNRCYGNTQMHCEPKKNEHS